MREIAYSEALGECLAQSMRLDPDIVLFGESIGDGDGVYGVTRGLQAEFGEDRVVDTPISEGGFTSLGVAAAMAGLRPVVEIMHMDFLFVGADAVVNQAPKYHYVSGGQLRVPIVFRMAVGLGDGFAGFYGGGAMQFQSLYAWFMHLPGCKVVMPSTAADAKGLLRSALLDDNPVILLEHKRLYARKGPVAEELSPTPIGVAHRAREGSDVTVIATGAMVERALSVAEKVSSVASVEVIDPRTLLPLDEATILESASKTGRVIVMDEGHRTGGIAGEIAAVLSENLPGLKSFQRVMAPDTPIPFSPPLVEAYVPSEDRLDGAICKAVGASS